MPQSSWHRSNLTVKRCVRASPRQSVCFVIMTWPCGCVLSLTAHVAMMLTAPTPCSIQTVNCMAVTSATHTTTCTVRLPVCEPTVMCHGRGRDERPQVRPMAEVRLIQRMRLLRLRCVGRRRLGSTRCTSCSLARLGGDTQCTDRSGPRREMTTHQWVVLITCCLLSAAMIVAGAWAR